MINVQGSSDLARFFPYKVNDLIRIGGSRDGGYVLPSSSLSYFDTVVSLGIGDDWSFEASLKHDLPTLTVIGCDFSITAEVNKNLLIKILLKTLAGKESFSTLLSQYKFNRDYLKFYHCKSNVNLGLRISSKTDGIDITMSELLATRVVSNKILLKMDIEGSEYHAIRAIIENSFRIPILCVEFHDCAALKASFLEYIDLIHTKYDLVHTHINNEGGYLDNFPQVFELTYQRKDITKSVGNILSSRVEYLPSKLDLTNSPGKPEYTYQLLE